MKRDTQEEKLRLGEVAFVRSGLVLSRKESKDQTRYSYPLLNLRAVLPNGTIDLSKIDTFIAKEALDTEYLAREGDIIIRLSQPYTAVMIDEATSGLVISSYFAIIRPEWRLLLPGYLFWLMNTPKVKQEIFENTSSNMMGAIKPKFFADFDLTLLPLSDQQKIADLHATARKEIQLLRDLADAKEKYYAQIIDQIQKKMRKQR